MICLHRISRCVFTIGLAVLLMTGQPSHAQEQVLQLRDADIRAFIDDVAMQTGRMFIVDPRVQGNVTVIAHTEISDADLWQVFLATLEVYGFTAVSTPSGTYRILPAEAAVQSAGPVSGEGAFVTEIFALRRIEPNTAMNMVRPLVHADGQVISGRGSDILIVVDYADNIHRIRNVIEELDRDRSEVRIVPLENTSATEMVRIVSELVDNSITEDRRGARYVAVANEVGNSIILRGDPGLVASLVPLIEEVDARNEQTDDISVVYLKHAEAADLAPILQQVARSLAGGTGGAGGEDYTDITLHPATNALIISAEPETQRALNRVISQLDIRRAQVLVEAIIVEVSDTAARELGVQYLLSGGEGSRVPFTVANYSNTAPNILAATGALVLDREGVIEGDALANLQAAAVDSLLGLNGFATGFAGETGGGTLFGFILNAVERDISSNVLSTPSVTTLDNEVASLSVGQEIPISTGEALGTNNANPFRTIERRDVGVQLDVRPQINEGETIQLFIRQEVSSVFGPVSENFNELILNKREIETTVTVDSGDIIVLGGLIEDTEQASVEGVPLLSRIPGVGRLFQSKARSQERRNLMVFIRPIILRGPEDSNRVTSRKYDYMMSEQILRSGGASSLDELVRNVMGESGGQ